MKKKVALSATAIAVLASTVPTHVAPVEATGNVIYVDSTKLSSNGDFSGAGTKDYPYRQLSTAIEKAQSGDTIIVIGEGYVNDLWDGTPWYIDKDITIRGEGSIPPTVSVRTPGIILGANVTFENVALGLANKTHDAIFANGHELNLINVSRAKGTRQVDLFAGGLAGATKYSAGNNPVINVITNNQFVGTINGEPVYSEFGGIYAGSMNGTYDKSAKIKVSNTGSTGILKVVSMHSSGAWQADPGNMLDPTEPALPQADPNTLVNYGDVEVTLENINLTVNGNTSPTATTTLKVIGKNFTSVNSNNIDNLELEGTTFTVSQNIFTNGLNQLTLSSNAILELTNYDEGNFEVSTYKGTGAIALPKQGVTVNIGNDFTSSDEVTFYLAGYNPFANSNGNATKNHVYFTTPSDNATINYEPSYVDEKLRLEPIQKGSRIEWTVIDPKNPPVTPDQPEPPKEEEGGDELPELPTITGFNISEQDKTLTKNVSEFNGPQLISIPFSVTTKEDLSNYYYLFLEEYEDLKVTVGEHEAVLTDDENDVSCFYVEDLNMYIYLQPTDEDDLSQQEITIEFKEDGIYVAPEVGTYNIGLSLNGQTLDTTLTIQGEDPDPELPDEEEGEQVPTPPTLTGITLSTEEFLTKNFSEFSSGNTPNIGYTLEMQTTGEVEQDTTLDKFEPTIKVGEHTATLVKEDTGTYYRVDDLNLNIEFKAVTGTNTQSMNIKFVDKDGQPTVPTQASYEFAILKDDTELVTMKLGIEDFPKPEEPTPDLSVPTIQGFDQSSYSTTKLATDELAIPFTVDFNNAPEQPIPFNELVGNKVIFNNEEWEYTNGYYSNRDHEMKLVIEAGEQVGQYTVILKHSREQEYLPEGDYNFTLGTSDNQVTFNYTVKPSMYRFVSLIDSNRTFKPSDFLATEDQQPFFIFNVARTGESSDLDTYEEFKVTINGEETQKVTVEGDGKLYYQASNQMVQAYIDYDEESTNHTLVLQSYNGDVPLKEQYEVTLSHPSAGTLTLTANVKEEEVPPTPQPPTPDEPEEEKLTYTLAETEQTQTVKSDEVNIGDNGKFAFKPEFSITDYDPYEFARGLTVIINDKPAAKVEGADEYLVDETGLCLIVYYDPDLYNGQGGYRVSFDDRNQTGNTKLSAGKYVATVTYGEDNPTATFTLNVEESKPVEPDPDPVLPPTPPVDPEPEEPKDEEVVISEFRVSDSKVDVQANQSFQATYGFTVVGTKDETNIDLTKHPLEFSLGGSKAEYREATNDYYIADKGLTVKVNRVNGENTYQLVVSGFSQNLQMGDNTLTMGIKDTNVSTDLTLSVKPPTVTNVSFPDGSTKTVDVDKAKLGVEFQFGLGFTDEDHSPLDFKDIGYAVSINGKETVLNGVDYALADSDLKVTFTKKANGLWQAFLFKSDTDGNRLPLPGGTYNIKAVSESSQDFEFSIVVEEPTTEPPQPPSTGGGTTTPPSTGGGSTTEPDNKEEEKEEPTTPPSTDGGNNGGSSSGGGTQPTPPPSSGGSTGGNTGGTTTPPSTGGGNSGGSSSGGGTTTPPSTGGTQPTPPPSTGGTVTPTPTPTPTPVPPKQEVTNQVEGLKDLAKELQEKVDSLMTDISVQENGTILDLVGDSDDLSNVSTLEITKEGLFINVDGEKIKFNTSLDLSNIDWDNTRVLRVGGGPVPHKHNGEGISITTANFNNLLITSKEPEPFTDVNEDDWFKQYVEDAYNYGLVNGTTAETFDPDGAITRAQLAVILARAFELEPTSEDSALSDIGDKWYASEVQALVDAGIIKGFSDGTFGGDKPVTRQQMALMLTRTVQSQGKDVTLPTKAELDKVKLGGLDKTSEEASDAIKYLALMEAVMSGPDIDFRPNSIATRAQATKVLVNTLPRTGLY